MFYSWGHYLRDLLISILIWFAKVIINLKLTTVIVWYIDLDMCLWFHEITVEVTSGAGQLVLQRDSCLIFLYTFYFCDFSYSNQIIIMYRSHLKLDINYDG